MPAFTTEVSVRLHFHLHDTAVAPAELLARAIETAHARVLARLDPAVDAENPPLPVAVGETLLAGAQVLESLAHKSAQGQRIVVVGGQRVDPGQEFSALLAAADRAERHGWGALAPYLWPVAPDTPLLVTEGSPVLGG
jgi:hypothetical protein